MKLNSALLKKFGILFGCIITFIYLLFLILPFALSPLANSYTSDIEKLVKDVSGLELKISKLGLYSTPILSLGVRAEEIEIDIPNRNDSVLVLDNIKGDLRLLPLLFKQVRLGRISADRVDLKLGVKKDGAFEVLDYIPQNEQEQEPVVSLPYGLKLSNHLPDISVKDYKVSFVNIENNKSYYLQGEKFKISDFILHKKIKFFSVGKIVLDDRTVSNYDIKIFNKIMPDILLDDLVFPKEVKLEDVNQTVQASDDKGFKLNIIDLFNQINKNQLKFDVKIDVKTSGTLKEPKQQGIFEINNLSVAVDGKSLPEGYLKLIFKGNKSNIDSVFYTSCDKSEKTQILGHILKDDIDLTFRSNAKFNSLIKLVNSIALSFGIEDFKTLSATGGVDAVFNIKSDFKSIISNGYLKVLPSSIKYGLYNVLIDNIKSDIDLQNSDITIKNTGFSVMGHPLTLSGHISSQADADLKLLADKLSLKSLLLTAGQVSLLKENDVANGTLSLNAIIKGKLSEIKPDISLNADNINIYNKPSKSRISLKNAFIKLIVDKDKFSGNVDVNSLSLKMDGASVSVPNTKIIMDTKDINISDTNILLNNSKLCLKGSVKDYLTDKLNMMVSASGNLAGADVVAFVPREVRPFFAYKGFMPVKVWVTGDNKIQNVAFDLSATPSGYVRFLNVDKLRNKNSKIHSDIKIENNSLKFENTSLSVNGKSYATLSGLVSDLSKLNLNLILSVPEDVSFTIPGMGEDTNITVNGLVDILGTPEHPKLKGKAFVKDLSVKGMDFEISDMSGSFDGKGISGSAKADKMKFGGITASNLSSKFLLKDYVNFYLNELNADSFKGKVNANISYNIPKFAFSLDAVGKGLNSTEAVYGAVGIKNALTGTMGFDAKLTGKGLTETDIIKSLKGSVKFDVKDGRFVSIGRLENFVLAQNITSNSVLQSAISALKTASALQETDRFKSITGDMSLNGGNATLSSIIVEGPLMSYYVKGTYHIIPNSANLTILGRIDSKVVSYLGPLGQLSVERLVSYIPGFGEATAKMIKLMTQDPKKEHLALIPALTNGSKEYSDFKVLFNGPVEKASSVKSFRWLSMCDTSKMDLKQEAKDALQAAKNNINSQVESAKNTAENMKNNVNNIVNTQKQNIDAQKNAIEQAKKDIQNIKQNAPQNAANLGNLLKNAVNNANKKMEVPKAETTTLEVQNTANTETKTQTTEQSSEQQTEQK